jgi:hypothetical protein
VGRKNRPVFASPNQDAESAKTGGFSTSAKFGLIPILTDYFRETGPWRFGNGEKEVYRGNRARSHYNYAAISSLETAMLRWSFVPQVGILLACLIAVPACIKNSPQSEGTAPAPVEIPVVVSSDYLLFAQLNVKKIRESALFTDVKEAFAKAAATPSGTISWNC